MKLIVKKEISKDEFKVTISIKNYGKIDNRLIDEYGIPDINIKKGIYGAYINSNLECNFNRNPNYYIKVNEITASLNNNFTLEYVVKFDDIDRNDADLTFSTAEKLAEAYCAIYVELIKINVLRELNKIAKGA